MNPEFRTLPKPRGTVADVLEAKGTEVHSIGPRETVFEAVVRLDEHEVGALPVMEGPTLLGVLSERDYTRKVAIKGLSSRDTLVQDIMATKVFTVQPTTTLAECMHIVTRHKIRHLPVLDGTTVVGILSIGDLVCAALAQQAETIERLDSFVRCGYPR